VEIPSVNVDSLNEYCKDRGLKFEFMETTFELLTDPGDSKIDSALKELVRNKYLNEYVTQYILKQKPIEMKKYAMYFVEPKARNYQFDALYYGHIKKHGEQWKKFHIPEFELPADDELKSLTGILIPGSSCHTYDNPDWQKALEELIRKSIAANPTVRILGVCYGGQTLAQCFGGEVEKMSGNFIRGSETLTISNTLYELPWCKDLKIRRRDFLTINESHGDHISTLPKDAVLHASSDRTKVELFTLGEYILGWQGHPEYNEQWTAGVIYRRNRETREFKQVYQEVMENFFPKPIEQEDVLIIAFSFLKYVPV